MTLVEIESLDLTRQREPTSYPNVFRVDSQQVGGHLWPNLIRSTQETGLEHVAVVGFDTVTGGLRNSKIFRGRSHTSGYPMFPYGIHSIKELVGLIRDVVVIHTHPPDPETDHLKIDSTHADPDISYLKETGVFMLMLGRTHAHLLVGNREEVPKISIVKEILGGISEDPEKAGKYQRTIEVVTALANRLLDEFGDRYFIAPNIIPTGGFVTFEDARFLNDPKT